MKVSVIDSGVSIVPETDFETEYLKKLFIGNNIERKVVVKSGCSISDLVSVNITVEQSNKLNTEKLKREDFR